LVLNGTRLTRKNGAISRVVPARLFGQFRKAPLLFVKYLLLFFYNEENPDNFYHNNLNNLYINNSINNDDNNNYINSIKILSSGST
jgi:hypothetical protein